MKKLTRKQILILHKELINTYGRIHGIRDENLFDSVLHAPFQSFDRVEFYPSLEEKAARLGVGLVANHPFYDRNKRIGAHAMVIFLFIDGVDLNCTSDELSSIFLSIASGKTDEQELVSWIRDHHCMLMYKPENCLH